MATATKKCRVCGKCYEVCHTNRNIAGGFRWQEVACSPECGSIYLAKVEESRRAIKKSPAEVEANKTIEAGKDTENIDIIDDEDEELYNEIDEYFDGEE